MVYVRGQVIAVHMNCTGFLSPSPSLRKKIEKVKRLFVEKDHV